MIYTLRHRTTYQYGRPVRFARCNLRLTPGDGDGQHVLDSVITVDPCPASRQPRRSFFGPQTVTIVLDQAHERLCVETRARVRVERDPPPEPENGLAWEAVARTAVAHPALDPDSPVHFLFPSRRIPVLTGPTDYARTCFPPGRSAYGGAVALMERIHADFRFDAEATTVSTPVATAFAQRAGVCQDFAQVMVAGLRGLGLPAAYVSGYLRTRPPPGRARLRGADASHAWVAVWCGARWLGLDPTNGVAVRDDHIELGRGRDYGDVAPIDGLVTGPGGQRLQVEVDVVPEGEPMPIARAADDGLEPA